MNHKLNGVILCLLLALPAWELGKFFPLVGGPVFGIIIGMTSVVVMMAIGQGTENSITKTMGDMAKNKISISSNG